MTSLLFEIPQLKETTFRPPPQPALKLERRPDGQLWASLGGEERPVSPPRPGSIS